MQYNENSSNGDASNCNTVCTTCSGEDSENNSITNVRRKYFRRDDHLK